MIQKIGTIISQKKVSVTCFTNKKYLSRDIYKIYKGYSVLIYPIIGLTTANLCKAGAKAVYNDLVNAIINPNSYWYGLFTFLGWGLSKILAESFGFMYKYYY